MFIWFALVVATPLLCLAAIEGPPSFRTILGWSLVGLHAAGAVSIARVGFAMKAPPLIAMLFIAAPCLIPVLNLILMPIDILDAARVLREAYGPVPAFGFSKSRLAELRNCCRRCRYPLAGLRSEVCPECGQPMTIEQQQRLNG